MLGEASECKIYTSSTRILDRVEDRHEAQDREDKSKDRGKWQGCGFPGVSSELVEAILLYATPLSTVTPTLQCRSERHPGVRIVRLRHIKRMG